MNRDKPQIVSIVAYEGGVLIAKWKLRPRETGTDIEQSALLGFQPWRMACNMLMVIEHLVPEMWMQDVKRLRENVLNDIADEEYENGQSGSTDLPF